MLLLLRWPCLLQDVLNRRYRSNKPAEAPKETITHHFFVSGIGQKKPSMQPKFVAAQKMLEAKQKPSKHSCSYSFYYFRHLYPLEARVISHRWVAHRYGQLYLHCSLIYWFLPVGFCIVISLFWGWNNSSSAVSYWAVALSTPGGDGFTHWLTDCFDVQPTTTSGNIITQSIIFSFSIIPFVYCIERSNITLTHLHVSNCRVRQLQFSGIFVALGFR